jgi:hypothetical protein
MVSRLPNSDISRVALTVTDVPVRLARSLLPIVQALLTGHRRKAQISDAP